MYYPEQNLQMPVMNYQYPLSEGPMGLTYMPIENLPLSRTLLMDETPESSGLQNGHAAVTSAPLTQPATPLAHRSPVQSIARSSRNKYFLTAVTPVHIPPFSRPATHSDTTSLPLKRRTDSRASERVKRTGAESYATAFIRSKLGDGKWAIFSARLFERRLGVSKPNSKDESSLVDSRNGGGANAIEFMIKVEIVKEVLRTYVPHPYNPLKSLKHQYPGSPTGEVTLTRSIVLALSGWSNTQFSYWARRVEAVSVLAPHDERLRTLASVFQQKLKDEIGTKPVSTSSNFSEGRSEISGSIWASESGSSSCFQREYDHARGVTGKGLDIIIDEVKKRTGASQFLRGKHSSLDPFGTIYIEGENGVELSAPMFMSTFQAVEYPRSLPPSDAEQPEKGEDGGSISPTTHTESEPGVPSGDGALDIDPSGPHLSFTVSDSRQRSVLSQNAQEPIPSTTNTAPINLDAPPPSRCAVTITGPHQNAQIYGCHQKHISREREHLNSGRKLFPVSDSRSDSRSELENLPEVYKRSGNTMESMPKSRTRQSDRPQ